MIILEGADGTGKTTLGETLAKEFHLKLIHSPSGADVQSKMQWISNAFNFHAARPNDIIIYDRFYFSEFIYGPLFRGGVRFPDWFIEQVETVWLPAVKPLIIHCDLDVETNRRIIQSGRIDMAGVADKHEELLNRYCDYFRERLGDFTLMYYRFNIGGQQEPGSIVGRVRTWLRKEHGL